MITEKINYRFEQERQGIIIAAPKSGSGKTLITCALIQALIDRGIAVCSYKCGPDYIDPMFHRTILGIAGGNLDTYFTEESQTRTLFRDNTPIESFAIVEGVMGLYDGISGVKEEGSSYHLATTLHLPIVLVVDAHGMAGSILPLIAGFLSYDTAHQISGVILNRVSASYYPILAELIEQELSIQVLGYFPEQKNIHLESRHLGLKLPEEILDLKEQLQDAAKVLTESVNVDAILKLGQTNTKTVPDIKKQGNIKSTRNSMDNFHRKSDSKKQNLVLAVAKDEAFCFYYQENLKMLSDVGFHIVWFSPIHDKKLPEGACALLLGGGYPELYAKELSENEQMKESIRQVIKDGMPSIAECGGFMYLHQNLIDQEETCYPMAGVLDADCSYQGKLVRFGYANFQEKNSIFLPPAESIKGHEFHYYDSTNNGDACTATKPEGTISWNCIWERANHWWGFPHLYYPSNGAFVEHFWEEAVSYKENYLFAVKTKR